MWIEDLKSELASLRKKTSRQMADLKFARQKEVSMKNAMYEKTKQIESMSLKSQQLVNQLGEIEDSFRKQQQEHMRVLQTKTETCSNWEASNLELKRELTKIKDILEQKKTESIRMDESLKTLEAQLRQKTEQENKHCQQVATIE